MDESNPNVVARLVALNERTRRAWAHPHNKAFYRPASFQDLVRDGRSRDTTPFEDDIDGNVAVQDTEPELRIDLNNYPKNMSKGWVFGSDQNACDVYCGDYDKEKRYNIGRQTFAISLSKQGNVIFKHLKNTNRTQIQYNDQRLGEQGEFEYIMLPYCKKIIVTSVKHLEFEVIVPGPGTPKDLCNRLRTQFLTIATPPMSLLTFDSGSTTPGSSLASTPKTAPLYFVRKDRVLGSGSFGKVYIVVDVSTGVEYAGKTFHGGVSQSEADILAKQNHENILRYISLSNNDGPLLVTDYVKEGNLARPWEEQGRPMWEIDQIVSILAQSLRALASLHARPNTVIHRDIKPANILVASLSSGPNTGEQGPHIKLADFGLAIEGTQCIGESGTYIYIAPEVYNPGSYSSKVDIWSLGVVILQLLMDGNVPAPSARYMQGPVWCHDIRRAAFTNCTACQGQDKLELRENEHSLRTFTWNFLRLFMLQTDPKHRLSAQDCLNHELFRQMYLGSRRDEKGWVREVELFFQGEEPSTRLALRKQFKMSPRPKVPPSESIVSSKQNRSAAPATFNFGVSMAQALTKQDSIDWGDAPQPIGFIPVSENQDTITVGKLGKYAS